MKVSALVAVLGLLSAVTAAPTAATEKTHSIAKRGLPRLGGINIAGCDFGMTVWGWSGTADCPGTDQITHFINEGANAIRLPFGWQYMVNYDATSSSLDSTFFATYDTLVQAATNAGAYAIIDLHNYGRWNSGVIGVDGPSNDVFARVWGLLAAKYKDNSKVVFALMNEPHDLDIGIFATSCQAAVNAIRAAGATSQAIVLPGNSWDNAYTWSSGANAAMLNVYDPSHSDKSLLILDVHKYLDSDGSGTSTECTTTGLDLLQPLATYLKNNGRQAIISEMGGGTTSSCESNIKTMLQYVVDNSDVFLGFTAWAAGSFEPYPSYSLSLSPNSDGSDNALWADSIKPFLPGNSGSSSGSGSSSCTVNAGAQCGGSGFTGCTTCAANLLCTSVNYYWQECQNAASCSVPLNYQCGGTGYQGCTKCASGSCTWVNDYWSECRSTACEVVKGYQCGGESWTGCTTCPAGTTCTYVNDWWWQCD